MPNQTKQMPGKVGAQQPNHDDSSMSFVDNARSHHAKILQPWLDSPKRP